MAAVFLGAEGMQYHGDSEPSELDLLTAMGGNSSKMAHTKKNLLLPQIHQVTSPYFWE